MDKITKIISTAIPIHIENIDTDQIIPARFLKAITREKFGENLFRDWRFSNDAVPIQDFVLNNDKFRGEILVAGNNFGCGSSREHAAWALYDYGFRVIISSFFADIFKSNALNNGMLPITVTNEQLHDIFLLIEENPNVVFTISLENQTLVVEHMEILFEIDAYKKQCLLNGEDDIDVLLGHIEEIESFEKNQIIF